MARCLLFAWLKVYVLLVGDKEENEIIADSESSILNQIRDELGKEIKGLSFLVPFERR